MLRRNLLLLVGIGMYACGASFGQTPASPAPATPQPSAPVPTPQSSGQIVTQPAYGTQQTPGTSAPVPQPAPQPAIIPAQPNPYVAMPPYQSAVYQELKPYHEKIDQDSSVYIPVDSWVYPEVTRLYSLGYVPGINLSMRPYTRRSLLHALKASQDEIMAGDSEEAKEILAVLLREVAEEAPAGVPRGNVYGPQSGYVRAMGIGGQTLRDSYHLGQTIINDYGRPYQAGFNSLVGFSSLGESGHFSVYVRGEYQHSPTGPGYSQALSAQLSNIDLIPFSGYNLNQATIPTGPIAAQNPFRLMEASVSYHVLGHEISVGKTDAWLGPAQGGSFAWSNNAENIYSFRIDRVEPLNIKFLSRFLGPVHYDFFYGSLKGHTDPEDDWVHSEMFSFQPTTNFTFGFQRTIIFGGNGHEPVTLHTFLKGFFDTNDTTADEKNSRDDPGARFSSFSFSYRLPFVRNYLTLYGDSECHDDVTPISAPRRAGWLSGLYLSQFPKFNKLDLRAEAVYTDYVTSRSINGDGNYFEIIQRQGYTNKGFIFGDWIGREAKGGQVWLTYHLSGGESVQLEYLNKKTPKDFIPLGTTQNQFKIAVVKRIGHDYELNAWYQYERWKAPVYLSGAQNDSVGAFQITYYPKLHQTASK